MFFCILLMLVSASAYQGNLFSKAFRVRHRGNWNFVAVAVYNNKVAVNM